MKSLQNRYGLFLLGVVLGLAAWFIDSVADWLWFANHETFWEVSLPNEPVEVWMRVLVLVICSTLGYIGQRTYNQLHMLTEELALSNAALALAKEAAEEASRTKSAFLTNISHELRTPMHAVLSFAALGRDRRANLSPEKAHQYFVSIHDSGMRLMLLLNDLLDISKIEAGRMEFHFEPCVIQLLIHQVCEDFGLVAAEKRLQLTVRESPDVMLRLDRERFTQVLRNLLSNAVKFSPLDGEICFDLESSVIHRQMADGGIMPVPAIALRVSDQGAGIPEHEIEKIFDKFTQGSSAVGSGGTGLGLAIVREIVTAHGGFVRAYNRSDQGAVLEVLLPQENSTVVLDGKMPASVALVDADHPTARVLPFRNVPPR